MSKHFSIYQTEAQFNAAAESLEYPHVSLIETTGESKYFKFNKKELYNAPFGSILMAEVSSEKLFYIDNSDYNLTDYPFSDFKPIGVCIYDKASNAHNETIFISVQWMDYGHLGSGSANIVYMDFGFNNYNLSDDIPSVRSDTESSKKINSDIAPYITKDYSGSSVSRTYAVGDCDPYGCCKRFKTIGTKEGDWFFPSVYDIQKYKNNLSSIKSVLDNIKTLCGSSYLNTTNFGNGLALFREINGNNRRIMYSDGSYYDGQWKYNGSAVKAVLVIGVEEV